MNSSTRLIPSEEFKIERDNLSIYVENIEEPEVDAKDFSLITSHHISELRGKYITKEGHASNRSRVILEAEQVLRAFYDAWSD